MIINVIINVCVYTGWVVTMILITFSLTAAQETGQASFVHHVSVGALNPAAAPEDVQTRLLTYLRCC